MEEGAGWFIRGDSSMERQLQQINHKVRLDQAVLGKRMPGRQCQNRKLGRQRLMCLIGQNCLGCQVSNNNADLLFHRYPP